MKKFNFKTLLILAIVIILALSIVLVSCGKKADPTPEPEPAPTDDNKTNKADYFTRMWDLSNSIGGEAISSTDNLAVSLDASLKIMQMKSNNVEAVDLNIGLKLDLIIDRNAQSAAHSAVRLGVYNGGTGDNYFAVYYFLDEPNFVYLDLGILVEKEIIAESDRYFKIQFETDHNGNQAYAGSVADLIKNHKFAEEEGVEDSGFTIADILDAIAGGTGENWTLNTLVQNIADLFNLDLASLLGSVQGMLGGGIVDEEGKIHLEKALSSKVVLGFIKTPTKEDDPNVEGRTIHKVDMNVSGLLSTIGSMLPEGIKKFINSQTDIKLSYGEKGGEIDGFSIYLGIKSEKDKKTSIYPGFELTIKDLSIRKGPSTKEAVQQKVEFVASKWTKVNLNVNKMLNAEASMEVEVYNKGVKTDYVCTAYSDIDIIDVIEGIVKIVKAEDSAARVAAFKNIHSEAGFKAVVKGSNPEQIDFQILASCPQAQLSWVANGKTTILDGADMLSNIGTIIDHVKEIFGDEQPAVQADDDDEEGGGFDISALMSAIELITGKVKINGEELSIDAVKAAFFDEDGNLKENWYEFLLNANFTAQDCDDLCKAFGGENANKIAVLIDKQAKSLHIKVDYENDAGVDAQGNVARAMYYVDLSAEWDLDEHTLELALDFNMWDDNAGKVVTYVCTYEGNLNIQNELLVDGGLTLRLTRQYADENAASPVFEAVVEGEINYNQAKDSITDASISLVVTDGKAQNPEEFFHIYGNLEVSAGKVLVKFTDDGLEYINDNATVDCKFRENLIQWIGGLDVDGTAIRAIKLPAGVRKIFKIDDENATIGDLLEQCHIHMAADAENVINTHYTSINNANGDTETFLIGLNEYAWNGTAYAATGDTFHLAFEFRRNADKDVTYVKCVYNVGEGDTGLGLKLDTFEYELGGDYIGTVAAPSREGATIYGATDVIEWIDKALAFIGEFMA